MRSCRLALISTVTDNRIREGVSQQGAYASVVVAGLPDLGPCWPTAGWRLVDQLLVNQLLVDQLLVDQLLVDQLLVDQLLVDQLLVDQLLADPGGA